MSTAPVNSVFVCDEKHIKGGVIWRDNSKRGTKTNLAAIYMSTHLEGKNYTSSGGGGVICTDSDSINQSPHQSEYNFCWPLRYKWGAVQGGGCSECLKVTGWDEINWSLRFNVKGWALEVGVCRLGFAGWGLQFGVWGFGIGVWGLGTSRGLGFGVWVWIRGVWRRVLA